MSEFIKENTESPGAAVFFECALAKQEQADGRAVGPNTTTQ